MAEEAPKEYPFTTSMTKIVFYKIWGEKINTHGRLDHRLLVLDEAYASLFKEKTFSSDVEPSRQFRWLQLNKFVFTPPNTMELTFSDGEIIFKHEDMHKIALELLDYVLNIFGGSGDLYVSFPNYFVEEFTPSPQGLLMRYRSRVFAKEEDLSPMVIDILSDFNSHFNGYLDVSSFRGNSKIIDDLLYTLTVDPRVKCISLPKALQGSSMWVVLARFLRVNTSLQTFIISETYDDDMEKVADMLAENKGSNLDELGFINSKFDKEAADIIGDIIETKKIKSLMFDRAIKCSVVDFMRRVASENSAFKKVQRLSIANQTLNVKKLMPLCNHLTGLSLVNIDVDIYHILNQISLNKNLRLARLNLSDNENKKRIPISTDFGGAYDIVIDNATFTIASFVALLEAAGNIPIPIKLSVKNATITTGDWNKTFAHLNEIKIRDQKIEVINWDGNVVQPLFFNYLKSLSFLRELSMVGSQISEGEATNCLCTFIKESFALRYLNLAGDEKNKLSGRSAINVFKAISQNRSLEYFNISYTSFKKDGLRHLADALMNNRCIRAVEFRENDVCDKESWNYFFTTLLNRGVPLRLTWPREEIEELLDRGELTEEEVESFQHKLALIGRGDPSIEVPRKYLEHVAEEKTVEVKAEQNASDTIEEKQIVFINEDNNRLLSMPVREITVDSQEEKIDVMNADLTGIVVPMIAHASTDELVAKYSLAETIKRLSIA